MTEQDGPADGGMAELKQKAEKFGTGYAAFSEAFSGPGVDRLVGAVKIGLAAFAVFVVASAIWSAL